jgi:phosphoserine phosphatase
MSRAETVARKGKQPTGSTAGKTESSSARAAIERRRGRNDVLAVFDVDGTLVETNIVEYFFWMRLRAQPLEDWPSFGLQICARRRWLYRRRSRADSAQLLPRIRRADYEVAKRLGREALNAAHAATRVSEGMHASASTRAGHRVPLLTGA